MKPFLRVFTIKQAALGVLIVTFAGFIIAQAMGAKGVWAWVSAFCEAATVGGFADWFAVTALFRRPMGLPIPHTGILPHNKSRLAIGTAEFVSQHFLAPNVLAGAIQRVNFSKNIGKWLIRKGNSKKCAAAVALYIENTLQHIDTRLIGGMIQKTIAHGVKNWNASATLQEIFHLLTADGHHQRLLDVLLQRLGHWLDNPHVKKYASALIVRYARKEWPTLVGTVNFIKPIEEIGDRLAERIAQAAIENLQEILTTPNHRVRRQYERWVQRYMQRMQYDAALQLRVNAFKQHVLEHPAVLEYARSLWRALRASMQSDVKKQDSRLIHLTYQGCRQLAARLCKKTCVSATVNTSFEKSVLRVSPRLRSWSIRHIAATINAWDDSHLVETIEGHIGRDLQYIRLNGSLIGGFIGVLLHLAMVFFSK